MSNRENRVCPWWMAYTFDNPLRKLVHNCDKILSPYVSEGMTAVDIGCGMGYFSLGLARIVGNTGHVYSVDLQSKMLNIVQRRAARRRLDSIIHTHQCTQTSLDLDIQADFVLTFWVVHEVPDTASLMQQIAKLLRPGNKYLLVEPKMHISAATLQKISNTATDVGLTKLDEPRIALSKAFLYEKPR